jgi:hypothetical protein
MLGKAGIPREWVLHLTCQQRSQISVKPYIVILPFFFFKNKGSSHCTLRFIMAKLVDPTTAVAEQKFPRTEFVRGAA